MGGSESLFLLRLHGYSTPYSFHPAPDRLPEASTARFYLHKKEGFDPTNGAEEAFDPMLKECLKFFIKSKKASASSLQGYFAMGYPKANKIVLQMEKAGFVSPGDHNGRRTLYITQQEFEERFGESLDE